MIARTPARFLAPLALVACIVAAVILINAASSDTKHRPARRTHAAHRHVPRIYHVRPGQGLDAIAGLYGIPVNQITTLNPQVDPRALQPGQKLQLVP
jgi:LysM repeat protein